MSEVRRARRTSCSSLGTSFAEASPGFPGSCCPAVDQVVIEHLGRGQDSDPLAPDRLSIRRVGPLPVEADADHREAVPPRGCERVSETSFAEVQSRGCSPSTRRPPTRRATLRTHSAAFEIRRSCRPLRRRSSRRSRGSPPRCLPRRARGAIGASKPPGSAASLDSRTPSKCMSPPNAKTTGFPLPSGPRTAAGVGVGEASLSLPPMPATTTATAASSTLAEHQELAGRGHEKEELERDRMCRHDSSPLE